MYGWPRVRALKSFGTHRIRRTGVKGRIARRNGGIAPVHRVLILPSRLRDAVQTSSIDFFLPAVDEWANNTNILELDSTGGE